MIYRLFKGGRGAQMPGWCPEHAGSRLNWSQYMRGPTIRIRGIIPLGIQCKRDGHTLSYDCTLPLIQWCCRSAGHREWSEYMHAGGQTGSAEKDMYMNRSRGHPWALASDIRWLFSARLGCSMIVDSRSVVQHRRGSSMLLGHIPRRWLTVYRHRRGSFVLLGRFSVRRLAEWFPAGVFSVVLASVRQSSAHGHKSGWRRRCRVGSCLVARRWLSFVFFTHSTSVD